MFKLMKQVFIALLTLIWVDFLGVCFEGGGKSTPCQKLVRIMLET